MKRFILAATTAAALTLSGANALAHDRQSGHGGMKAFLSQLDLSMAQKLAIRSQVGETRDEMSVYRQDFKKLHQEMKALMESGNLEPASVSALLTQYEDTIKSMVKSRAKVKHVVWNTLEQEQKDKAEQLKLEKMANFSPEKADEKVATLLESLNLSIEQKQPVMDAVADLREGRQAMRNLVKSFMTAQRDIIRSEAFDETAWETLFEQQFPQFTAGVVEMVSKRQALRALLTPEQQEQLPGKKGMKFLKRMMQS